MKITHNKVGQNLNISDTAKTSDTAKAKGKSDSAVAASNPEDLLGAARVEVSPRAQEMKKIRETAMNASDVDEAKVARLQKMIDEGTYKVDASDIADKMVDEQINWS